MGQLDTMRWWGGCGCGCVALTLMVVLQVVAGQNAPTIQNIRLAGTNRNSTSGRVEVQINGVYGTVCDDLWEDQDAVVVCKQLGLSGGIAVPEAGFGEGSGFILLDDVNCAGDEDNLNECYFSFGSSINCEHNEDAGVVCQPAGSQGTTTPVTTTTQSGVTQPDNCGSGTNQQARVRLFGPQSQPGVGYVQVRADNGTYGYVCDDGWDINAAKVVCNELCFNRSLTESSMKKEYQVGVSANVVFALDDVECVGTESSLALCSHSPWFSHNCNPTELAAVTCVTVNYVTPTPPSPNLQCRDGDLIALFSKTRDPNLEGKHLSLDVDCAAFTVDDSDANYITATIPFDDCGTNVTQNQTHIIYTNTISMESTTYDGPISRVNEYRVVLICEMPRNGTVDKDVRPLTETVTQRSEGEFIITMTIYQDRRFTVPAVAYPFELVLGEWLNVGVELEAIDSRLKLVVTDCIASPNLTDATAPTITLLEDKCVSDRLSLEVHPLTKVMMGFRFQSFIFVNYPLVVLQCQAIVCLTSEVTNECDRSCNSSKPAPASGTGNNNRRRRDVSGFAGEDRRRRDVTGTPGGPSGSKTVYTVRSFPVVVVQLLSGSTANPLSSSSLVTTNTTATPTPTTTTATPTTTTATTTTTPTTTTTTPKPTTTTTATPARNSTTARNTVTTTPSADDTTAANASATTTTSTTSTPTNLTSTTNTTKSAATIQLTPTPTTKSTTTSSSTTTSAATTTTTTTTTTPSTTTTTTTISTTSTTSGTTRTPILITVRGTPSPVSSTTSETSGSSPAGGIHVAESSASRLSASTCSSSYAAWLLPVLVLWLAGKVRAGGGLGPWV